jgi:hypothetical protein
MSHRSRGLKQFGCTLPGNKRSRLVETFWRDFDPAIESSGLTMIERSPPIVGKSFNANPCASPPLGGGGSGRHGIVFKFKDMKG